MKINQVAVQLYTLRDHLTTPQDVASTLKRVREIGYEAVQISGMKAPMSEEAVVEILDGEGLFCCATHEGTSTILDEPEKVIERLKKLRCPFTAIPSHGTKVDTLDGIKAFTARADAAGAKFAEAGLGLGYHNHDFEFMHVEGKTILDHFYDLTDPANLKGELDTYWIQAGGGDPVAWCQKLAGRMPAIHLKDYRVLGGRKPDFAEIGYGNLNMKAIVQTAEAGGCEWFIIEQDTTPGDPFDSLKMSFDYIRDNLVS